MPLSLRHKFNRLPKRFPVGTTFVIEGRTVAGDDDNDQQLLVFSRFVVFMLSMVYSAIADNLLEQILGTRSPIPAQVVLFVPATIAAIVFVAWRQAKIR